MMRPRRETRTIGEQAAEWLVVLSEGGAAEQAAFLAWLKQSPRHVEEFLFATTTWKTLCELGERQPLNIEAILSELKAEGPASNVVSLGVERPVVAARERRSTSTMRAVRWSAAFGAIALLSVLGWWLLRWDAAYSTAIGEQLAVRLDDGSVLHLNTGSRARVDFSDRQRNVELLEGEALFVVAHDPSRPFLVRTDDAIVQAVGTQFNVRHWSGDTRVAVIEGRVRVAHRASESLPSRRQSTSPPVLSEAQEEAAGLLSAGEEARIESGGRIVRQKSPDIAQVIAWRERRVVFRAERLENVVAEINRYTTRRFRIEGTRARDIRLTATFDADKPESLAAFLEQYADLSVEATPDGFVIQER